VRRRVGLLLALLVTLAQAGGGGAPACPGGPRMDLAGVQQRLTAAEALWQRRGLGTYRLTAEVNARLSASRLFVQQRGPVVAAQRQVDRPYSPGQPSNTMLLLQTVNPALARRYSVPGLFAQVRALLRDPLLRPCGDFSVTFDATDGHLRSLVYYPRFTSAHDLRLTVSPLSLP
jgi:hypothetical protein